MYPIYMAVAAAAVVVLIVFCGCEVRRGAARIYTSTAIHISLIDQGPDGQLCMQSDYNIEEKKRGEREQQQQQHKDRVYMGEHLAIKQQGYLYVQPNHPSYLSFKVENI